MAERWAVTVTPGEREGYPDDARLRAAQRELEEAERAVEQRKDELARVVLDVTTRRSMTGGEISRLLGCSRQHIANLLKRAGA